MRKRGLWSRGRPYLAASVAIALTVTTMLYPEEAFASALGGLRVWWDIVFPALLPFFILSEILMGLGVVSMMGVLLEPLMRPLFNVPGVGSFVMAMGLASGYPIGAILTAKLRRQRACTQVEAERLLSFTNTADPLFMFGAVAVGMFADARLGSVLALAHYLSSLTVGFIMRFYRRSTTVTVDNMPSGPLLLRALRALPRARRQDGRPLGQLFGDAVRNSVTSLLNIGGFIILFSVIIRMATIVGLVDLLAAAIAFPLAVIGISSALSPSVVSGFFEITIGTELCASAGAPLLQRVALAGAIIAWSGLSVHGQVASILHDTDIRIGPYVVARFVHAVLAFIYTVLLWNVSGGLLGATLPVLLTVPTGTPSFALQRMAFAGVRALAFIGIALVLSAIVVGLCRLRIRGWRPKT